MIQDGGVVWSCASSSSIKRKRNSKEKKNKIKKIDKRKIKMFSLHMHHNIHVKLEKSSKYLKISLNNSSTIVLVNITSFSSTTILHSSTH